jgi:hypothetical protein
MQLPLLQSRAGVTEFMREQVFKLATLAREHHTCTEQRQAAKHQEHSVRNKLI